jgi:hypothetical protein
MRIESRMGRTQLFQTTGVEEQWHGVVAPWLEKQTGLAGKNPQPTVILTPSRAESFYLRSRLVREGISFLGLRFWIPSDARTFLLGEISIGVRPATQAELRLVARISAEKLARSSDEPTLASVEREPGLFLRAYDLLLGAGWDPAKGGAAYGRKLAREMARALKEGGIATQAELHRLLRRQAAKLKEPLLANLLVSGFNASHWPLWDLLRATVAASGETTLSFLAPREFGAEIDQLWIGSWEEETGEAVEIPTAGQTENEEPFADWVGSYERGAPGDARDCDFTFLAGPDLHGQVRAVVLRALAYLASESCQRLGIVFPEENALALGVAEELRRLGVPLNDGTGYLQPGIFESRAWPAWLSLQEEPSVQRLIEWIRACEAEGAGYGAGLLARDVADVLDAALGETLVDDLSFLSRHLEENSKRGRAHEVAEFLRSRFQLPESGTFSEFFAATRQALQELGWADYLDQKEPLREAAGPFFRRAFLAWLRESTDSQERTRGPGSNHFYGKVHLLIYAQMTGQSWTHLILTGLNEGSWPRVFETGAFGSRHELMELNRQARALNRRGTRQGAQGAGHEAVLEDRGHCLLPLERQDLALRDLCAAVESTGAAICFTAMTAEAGRALLPTDFFVHAYQARTGRVLDEEAFSLLAKSTAVWSEKQAGLLSAPEEEESLGATRIAYAARRDPEQSFGPYEFAFAEPPPEPIQLACKTWETAWNHPASVWLEKIVGVSSWPEGQLGWARAVGTWVHRWLTSSLESCRESGEVKDFRPLLRAAAERERQRATERTGSLPPWWHHVWGEARAKALGLGDALAPQLAERFFLSEYRLPGPGLVALPGTDRADFELRGQIDLLLIEPGAVPLDPTSGSFSDCSCWVIDFKTGSAKNLTPSRLEKGIGLQAMLYALAVRAAGAASIAVSLHTFDAPLKPQVQIGQIEANVGLFRSLDRLHRAGIFGQRPDAENEYAFAPAYPMATRPIAAAVLEAKWALVHGAAALWEGS